MPDVREISVSEYIGKVADLTRAHWQETEPGVSSDGPCPVADVYAALEQVGNVVAFGAFDGDELIGYSVAILGPHLHYGFTYAHHDLLYVRPDHRRGSLGLRLMRMTEEAAKARGARFVVWHVKPGSTLESILSRAGYAVEEVVYKKEF